MSELTRTRLILAVLVIAGLVLSFFAGPILLGLTLALALWWAWTEWKVRHAR